MMSSLARHRAAFWASLTARERRTLTAMASAVVGSHVLGFVALLAFVAPGREHLGRPRR